MEGVVEVVVGWVVVEPNPPNVEVGVVVLDWLVFEPNPVLEALNEKGFDGEFEFKAGVTFVLAPKVVVGLDPNKDV